MEVEDISTNSRDIFLFDNLNPNSPTWKFPLKSDFLHTEENCLFCISKLWLLFWMHPIRSNPIEYSDNIAIICLNNSSCWFGLDLNYSFQFLLQGEIYWEISRQDFVSVWNFKQEQKSWELEISYLMYSLLVWWTGKSEVLVQTPHLSCSHYYHLDPSHSLTFLCKVNRHSVLEYGLQIKMHTPWRVLRKRCERVDYHYTVKSITC